MSAGNRCFMTLVSNDDFVTGARALARSIKAVRSAYPLLVLSTYDAPSVRSLEQWGAQIVLVDPLPLSEGFQQRHSRQQVHSRNPFTKGNKPAFHSPLDNFAKLWLFSFEAFQKIVFLDADTMLVQNCDRLFDYPAFSAAPNVYESLIDFQRMNSGVFVAQPQRSVFDDMLNKLDAPDAYWPRTDQTFLQHYFPNWHGLPYLYNCLQYVYFQLPELWDWSAIKLLHFQYEKPWQSQHPKSKQLAPLIKLWQVMYDEGLLLDEGAHKVPYEP